MILASMIAPETRGAWDVPQIDWILPAADAPQAVALLGGGVGEQDCAISISNRGREGWPRVGAPVSRSTFL